MSRADLISLIYKQITKLQTSEFKDKSAFTLMVTDVDVFCPAFTLYMKHGSLLEVGIGLFLLERQSGIACLIPAVISMGMLRPHLFLQNYHS